jgi:prepilin-type N-terminal cleavage/methylation domain-containing protein
MKTDIRKAFTLLELIIVIVLMGIVGKYGVELLMQAYESYIGSSIQARFQAQSEGAVQQIANRLQYRIPPSLIVRQGNTAGGALINTFSSIEDTNDTDSRTTVLEWIGYDIDGWRGDETATTPTWSGVIDLDAINDAILLHLYPANASVNLLISPGTDTARSDAVISALSNGTKNTNDSAIFFIGEGNINTGFNSNNGFGWFGALTSEANAMHRVTKGIHANEFAPVGGIGSFAGQKIGEYYRLSWTAYALEFDRDTHRLTLYYNYRPWAGENYINDGTGVTLMENVDTFKFASLGDLIKVQVCVTDPTLFTGNYASKGYSICKEKTVF